MDDYSRLGYQHNQSSVVTTKIAELAATISNTILELIGLETKPVIPNDKTVIITGA